MDFAAEFLDQTKSFGDLTLDADPALPVPTCPGWTMKQLFRHVGRGNRWSAQIIAEGTNVDPAAVPDGKPPADLDGARQWLLDGAQLLVDAATAAGDKDVWTFVGPKPANWWLRRRLHEVVVHRADAAIAAAADFDLAPALAADAISEWLDIVTALGADLGSSRVHLHATDEGLGETGEWTIAGGAWTHGHDKGDVAVRGPAKDVLLVATGRRTVADGGVEMFGDDDALRTWLAGMSF